MKYSYSAHKEDNFFPSIIPYNIIVSSFNILYKLQLENIIILKIEYSLNRARLLEFHKLNILQRITDFEVNMFIHIDYSILTHGNERYLIAESEETINAIAK